MIEIWDEVAAMQRRLDGFVREFLGPRARLSQPEFAPFLRRPFLPATDLFVHGDDMVIRMELAGIDPEKDLRLTLEDDQLVIRGERRRSEEVKDQDYYRVEVDYGTFERRVPVAEGIDEKKVHARYEDGVLEITLPKAVKVEQAPKAKTIPVTSVKPTKSVKAA